METGAGVGAHTMKERDIVNENEPSASSPLSRRGSYTMSKLDKKRALLWLIYDIMLRNVAEQNFPGVNLCPGETKDFLLVGPSCHLQNVRKDDRVELTCSVGVIVWPGLGSEICDEAKSPWALVLLRFTILLLVQGSSSWRKRRASQYQRRFWLELIWKRGDKELKCAAVFWDRELFASLYPCSWRLSTKIDSKACSAHACGGDFHLLSSVGSDMRDPFGQKDSRGHGKIATNHSCWTGAMKIIPRVSKEDRLFSESTSILRKNMLLRPEQTSLEWMINLVYRLATVVKLVLDICAGTIPPEKAFLQLPEDRWFVASEKSSACFGDELSMLMENFSEVYFDSEIWHSYEGGSSWRKRVVCEGDSPPVKARGC